MGPFLQVPGRVIVCERFARPKDAMRAWPHATAMSERALRAWGWRPGHAWGLSCKLPETLRGPPHTVPCEHSIALTSKQIGRWGFPIGRVFPIRSGVSGPAGSICEHSWRSCAYVSLASGAPSARDSSRVLCDPDRIVHTFSESGSYCLSILFVRRFNRARGTLLSPFEHR